MSYCVQVNILKSQTGDNIAKAILDSLNGLAYKDDSQVTELIVLKEYGTENKIYVELEEIGKWEKEGMKMQK